MTLDELLNTPVAVSLIALALALAVDLKAWRILSASPKARGLKVAMLSATIAISTTVPYSVLSLHFTSVGAFPWVVIVGALGLKPFCLLDALPPKT